MKLLATLLTLAIIVLLASSSLALSQYVEIAIEPPPSHFKTITLSANQEFYLRICGAPGASVDFYLYELSTGNVVYNISFPIGSTGCTVLRLKAPSKHGFYIALFNIDGSIQMLLLRVGPPLPLPKETITVTVTSTTTTVKEVTVTETITTTKTITTTTILHLPTMRPVTVYVTEYAVSPLAPKIVFTRVYGITKTVTTTATVHETSTATVTMPIYQTVYEFVKSEIPIIKTSHEVVKVTETKVVKETVPKLVQVREYLVNVSSLAATFVLGVAMGMAIMSVYGRR